MNTRGIRGLRNLARSLCSKKKTDAVPSTEVQKLKMVKAPPAAASRGAVVTLLGANCQAGEVASLILKMKGERIQELRLWDNDRSLRGLAMDIAQIPSRTGVISYVGEGQLPQALRNSDNVVVLDDSWGLPKESTSDLFYKNCEKVRDKARAIILSAPRAMIGVAVPPITPMVSFFGQIQKSLGASCPNRLFGLLSLEEMRAKTVAAEVLGLPPHIITVKLTGGGTPETLIPVLSVTDPGGEYLMDDYIPLTNKIRNMTEAVKEAKKGAGPVITSGVAVAKFVRTVAEGMYGDKKPVLNAVVRADILHGVPYFALSVTIGKSGIEEGSHIPRLRDQELSLLFKALSQIQSEISLGEAWAHSGEEIATSVQ